MMREAGAILGAAFGFFLGNDVLPRYLTEPNPALQSGEGAFWIDLATRLGTPIALGLLGIAAGEGARRFFRRVHLLT